MGGRVGTGGSSRLLRTRGSPAVMEKLKVKVNDASTVFILEQI